MYLRKANLTHFMERPR
ncbi:hypothetical protein DERF_004393 [Dermatophagoides farinae]|uniref:Uncharacterized protein n=1 Tax=Dermatophagoides farinae TaxID=6954 RepID=A0A922I3P4_DERFA|nr:hypothetical protein DERF_004393 [Dermatophagoides farinae]